MTDNEITFQPDTSQNIQTILHRRKMMVVGIFLVCFSTFALLIQGIKPVYIAKAQIAFVGKDEPYIKTQQHYITSINMARQVVKGLNLSGETALKTTDTLSNQKFKTLNLIDTLDDVANNVITKEKATLIYDVLEPLSVSHPEGSYVLDLSYTHHDPKRAAQILSSFIRHYAEFETIDQINRQSLQSPVANWQSSLKADLNQIRTTLKNLKYPQTKKNDSSKRDQSFLDYKRAQQNFITLKTLLSPFLNKNGELALNPLAPILRKSETLQDIEQENKRLHRKLDSLSLRYGYKHPKIKSLQSEISIITAQISKESEAIMLQLKSDYEMAESRLKELEKEQDNDEITASNLRNEQLNILEPSMSKTDDLLSKIESHGDLFPPAQLTKPQSIHVITPAITPLSPIFPDKIKLAGFSFALSLLIAISIVIFIEKNRKTFLSGRQLENALKRPCYALIPKIKSDKDKKLADYVLDHPGSDITEAVRALRLNIKLRVGEKGKGGKSGQVVTITSSKQNEGKTTLCAWLGRLAAKSGEKVLLIDADLRVPCLHTSLGTKSTLSLVDYLAGKNKLEEIIDTNDPSGLHVIYGRAVPNSALDLVSSKKMDRLISSLQNDYDLIIIDTPACMAVSDARALQKYSDLMLYVVAWHKTRREVIHSGISQFIKFEDPCIATVLTNIDVKKHVQLGYGEIVSDYGAYKPV